MSSGSAASRSTRLLEQPVEELVERLVGVLGGRLEPLGEVVGPLEHADLAVEAVEEAHVARLVGDLGREEDPLLLGRGGAHDRAELVGDLLLADEEGGEPVHAPEPLVLGDPLVPVDPVLGEVEVLGQPLLALPELVELRVAEQLRLAAIRRLCSAGSQVALKSSRGGDSSAQRRRSAASTRLTRARGAA